MVWGLGSEEVGAGMPEGRAVGWFSSAVFEAGQGHSVTLWRQPENMRTLSLVCGGVPLACRQNWKQGLTKGLPTAMEHTRTLVTSLGPTKSQYWKTSPPCSLPLLYLEGWQWAPIPEGQEWLSPGCSLSDGVMDGAPEQGELDGADPRTSVPPDTGGKHAWEGLSFLPCYLGGRQIARVPTKHVF